MYIDGHTHLDFFEDKIDIAIEEINKNKILTLANSMDIESYKLNKEFAKRSKYIIPSFGIHPWKAKDFKDNLEDLKRYIKESKLIGEIGLDFFWEEDKSTYKKQREIFNYILNESINHNKFISIHTKGAEEEIYNILKNKEYNKVIIHWYSGDLNTLKKLIDLRCYFTISVDIGYSELSEKILSMIPLDRLLLETDGPTALEWVNGEYGYPSYIKEVYKNVAILKNISLEYLENIIEDNLNKILSLTKR
ncbi:TatD family hydrolase [Clostridium sp.]|uniref:TatD family hydrolase n=1 Tax=Clostridium sp. TaxID=1506 RepID=UPI002621961C|nr:TatD family hydrolase [Clostridium sp.]